MALKTDYLIGLLQGVEAQAANRAAGNQLIATVRGVKKKVEARKELGEDPDTSQLAALYAQVSSAVDVFNAQSITLPSVDDVAAGVAAADSAEE